MTVLRMDFSSSLTELFRGSGLVIIFNILIISSLVAVFVLSNDTRFRVASALMMVAYLFGAVLSWLWTRLHGSDGFEGFDNSEVVIDSTMMLRKNKSDIIVPAMAQFFTSGNPAVYNVDINGFNVFWQPSAKDYEALFLDKYAPNRTWTIDNITCVDGISHMPLGALSQDLKLAGTPTPMDCKLYIDDGEYACFKTALSLDCRVRNVRQGGESVYLMDMVRSTLACRTFMLLRPFLVRVGSESSRLYKIDYSKTEDGMTFDSVSPERMATLRLVSADQWDLPRDGSVLDTGRHLPPEELGVHNVVCYYVSYTQPRAGVSGDGSQELRACTVAVPWSRTTTSRSMKGVVSNSGARQTVLEVIVTPQSVDSSATIKLNNDQQTYKVPAGRLATVATYTRDCLIVASLWMDRVLIRRFHDVKKRCSYRLAYKDDAKLAAFPGVAAFPKTAIPNLGDLYGRMDPTNLAPGAKESVTSLARNAGGIAKVLFQTPDVPLASSDTLLAFPEQALTPGTAITSPNGKYQLLYAPNGNLALVHDKCDGATPVKTLWASLTNDISTHPPSLARLDGETGIITLQDDRGYTYWRSSLKPVAQVGLGRPPYRLVVTNDATLEIKGRDDKVYWTRSAKLTQSGYPKYETCEQASEAYARANAEAIKTSTLGGRVTVTPWQHFIERGGRDSLKLDWPGPYCV